MKERVTFLLKLAKAFHRYGTNSPRIERAMNTICSAIGLEGSFIVTPTSIIMSIENGEEQHQRVQRMEIGHVNLEKLGEVDSIADRVVSGELTFDEASHEIDSLLERADLYSWVMRILSFSLAAFSLGTLFGGTLIDSLVSALIGSILGTLAVIEKRATMGDLFLSVGSFLCTLAAFLCKLALPELNFQIITLASIIVIIPGLSLTVAMIELSAEHLVSGTSRLMGVVVDLFKISIGVMAAVKIGTALWGETAVDITTPLSDFWTFPAIVLGAAAFVIIFNARRSDFGWFLLSGGVAILTIHFLTDLTGSITAVFLAALFVGMGSNLFARLAKRPAQTMLLPGIIFLVPGSVGYHGVNLMMNHNEEAGIGMAFEALTVSMAVVAGLLFANYVINPRRSL